MDFSAICRSKFEKVSFWYLPWGHSSEPLTKQTIKKLYLWGKQLKTKVLEQKPDVYTAVQGWLKV